VMLNLYTYCLYFPGLVVKKSMYISRTSIISYCLIFCLPLISSSLSQALDYCNTLFKHGAYPFQFCFTHVKYLVYQRNSLNLILKLSYLIRIIN
jgi:hypothetical protein